MPSADNVSVQQIEVEEFLQTRVVRRRLLPRAVLVGLASGLVAVVFRIIVALLEGARDVSVKHLHTSPGINFLIVAAMASVGTYLAMLVNRVDPDVGGSGIPQMKAILEGHLASNWVRVIWAKFVGAGLALGTGLALGREGPTVQMGGAIGQGIGLLTKATERERRALGAAGAGAGLAAAFNAPLAGVTFVLEELQRDFQPIVFVAALLSAALATVVSRLAAGQFPVFQVPHIEQPTISALPIFAVVGVAGGVLGVAFNKFLLGSISRLEPLRTKRPIVLALFVGLAIAGAWEISPLLIGGGHGLSEQAIHGELTFLAVTGFFVVRFLLIHLCYSTGVPGGIFAPLLSLGALLGLAAFQVGSHFFPASAVAISACVVAGMCAMFSSIVRAPLTGVILIGEMTGSYDMLLPLLLTAFAAYAVAESLGDMPIYEALLQRFSATRGLNHHNEERRFAELEIQADSTMVGKRIKEFGLPEGVLVVLCSRNGREFIPNGNTVFQEHMKLSVVSTSSTALKELERVTRSKASWLG